MNNTFDEMSCEEVFELNAVCDEWQNEAIEAQEFAKRDTITLNGNVYFVNNDPKLQRRQLAGYRGNNPK